MKSEERKKEALRGKDLDDLVGRDEIQDYLIESLKEMVRIPTFVPPGEHYGEIVDWLIPRFNDLGFTCERIEMPADIYETRQKSPN